MELPDELWLLVAVHLTKRDTQNLYLTKRSLLDLARDLRYQEIFLLSKSKLSLESMIEYHTYLLNPQISRRIHSLTLNSLCIATYDLEEYSRGLPLFNKLSSKRNQVRAQKRVLSSLMHQILRDLTNLRTLTIDNRDSGHPVYVSLVSSFWKQRRAMADGNSLLHLCLHITVNGFQELLPEPESSNVEEDWRVMAQLESLEIELYPHEGVYNATRVASSALGQARLTALLNLLTARRRLSPSGITDAVAALDLGSSPGEYDNRHEYTNLRTLSIHFHEVQRQLPIFARLLNGFGMGPPIHQQSSQVKASSRLFIPASSNNTGLTPTPHRDIPPLPNLTHLSLTTGGIASYFGPGIRILTFLASTVTHLRVSPHYVVASPLDLPPETAATAWHVAPAMSFLEYLELIGLRDHADLGISTMKAYLTRTELKQLRTLIFDTNFPLSYTELFRFFLGGRVIPGQLLPLSVNETSKVSLSHIHNFSLSLITLTPGHLALLSRFLPGLRHLNIRLWANRDQGPYRGSYKETGPREEPVVDIWPSPIHLRQGSGLPKTMEDRIRMQEEFLEELDQRLDKGEFEAGKIGGLEDIRISVQGMEDERVNLERIKERLRKMAPAARVVSIGEDGCPHESVFNEHGNV